MISDRRRAMRKLGKQRALLQRKMDAVDRQIAALGGTVRDRKRGGRARNDVSLPDAIQKVLSEAQGALGVGEIAEKVRASGYESRSENFRGIVNQMLVKDRRFVAESRGVYRLTGAGTSVNGAGKKRKRRRGKSRGEFRIDR